MPIKDRVVVITGATGSTGQVAARMLSEQGARLALISRDQEKLQQLAAELNAPAERVLIHAADLREAGAVRGAAEAARQAFGRVDVLFHLVGGWTGGAALVDASAEDLESMLDQHVWTTFHLLQAFVPIMRQNGWGRVIAVSSPSAQRVPARGGLYAAAKAAEEALLLSLASEVAGSGVTANILQVRTIDAKHERDQKPTPANRSWTTPEEITAALIYLCSDEACTVNGARLPLFGAS